MFKWLKEQKGLSQKLAGLEEKKQATQRKIDVANKILEDRQTERRYHTIQVEEDRRRRYPGEILQGIG